MPVENKGFEYALTEFKNVAVKARLYGVETGEPIYVSDRITIDWQNPVNNNGWQLVSDANTPMTWELLPSGGGTISIIGVEISDTNGTPMLIKDFEGSDAPYTFTARSIFNLEQVIINAGIDSDIIPD